MNASLDYPIIVDAECFVMDGGHRLAKAMLLGHDTMQGVRLQPTPPPDLVLDAATTYLDYLASFEQDTRQKNGSTEQPAGTDSSSRGY